MPTHITEDHSIHQMSKHGINEVTWQGTGVINVFDNTEHTGAKLVAQITNGTSVERLIVEMGYSGVDTGFDVTRILLSGSYLSLSFASSLDGDNFVFSVTNTVGTEDNTIKYYTICSDL